MFCTIAGPRPARPFYLVHPAQHHGGSHDEYTKVSQIFHKFIILWWHDFISVSRWSCVRFWDTEVLTDCWDFSHCGCSSWVDPERWAPYFSTTYQSTRNMVNEWTLFIRELMWMDLDLVIAICVKVSRRVGLSPHKSPPVLLVYSTFSSKTFEITYINMDLEPHHFFSWGQTAPEHTKSMIDVHTTKIVLLILSTPT